jgi:hypothetical protein
MAATQRSVRGRFYVQRDEDGWTVVDSATTGCLSWPTKKEAQDAAAFARAYVKRWGDIDFQTFPYHIEQPFAGWTCEVCWGHVSSVVIPRWDGGFHEGHDDDCPRYGQPGAGTA